RSLSGSTIDSCTSFEQVSSSQNEHKVEQHLQQEAMNSSTKKVEAPLLKTSSRCCPQQQLPPFTGVSRGSTSTVLTPTHQSRQHQGEGSTPGRDIFLFAHGRQQTSTRTPTQTAIGGSHTPAVVSGRPPFGVAASRVPSASRAPALASSRVAPASSTRLVPSCSYAPS
ncbi:unnamed protein product, partial [Amoebophrya sp. A25]